MKNTKKALIVGIGIASLGAFGAACYILGRHDMYEECNNACQNLLDNYEELCSDHVLDMIVMSRPGLKNIIQDIVDEWKEKGFPEVIDCYWSLKNGGVLKWEQDGVEYGKF